MLKLGVFALFVATSLQNWGKKEKPIEKEVEEPPFCPDGEAIILNTFKSGEFQFAMWRVRSNKVLNSFLDTEMAKYTKKDLIFNKRDQGARFDIYENELLACLTGDQADADPSSIDFSKI